MKDLSRRVGLKMLMTSLLPLGLGLGPAAFAQTLDGQQLSPEVVALLQDNEIYNSRCRGGSGDDPETWVACGARDYSGYLLNQAGVCFGQTDQPEAEWVWHLCTTTSQKLEKP